MEVSENSLANLIPGPKGDRFAGVDLVVAAIAGTLVDEFAEDEAVRFELCKVDDFAVTPTVRAAVISRKSERILNAILEIIRKEVVGGGVVSINGFATMWRAMPDVGWPVGIERGSYSMRPIRPGDVQIRETRAAAVRAGNWVGEGLAAEYAIAGATYQEGTIYEHNNSTGVDTVINGSVIGVSGSVLGLFNEVVVTAVGSDGAERQYTTGGLNILVFVERQLRPLNPGGQGGDLQMWYLPVSDQAARLAAARVGKSEAEIERDIGSFVPMGVGEWHRIAEKAPASVEASVTNWEFFPGMPAANILSAYPRVRTVIRVYSSVYEVRRIAQAVFRAQFGFQETYLRSIGAWPERSRNTGAVVSVDFRQEFIDAVQ